MPPAKRKAEGEGVTLTLAHPLLPEQAERLGGEKKDYAVGDEITVRDRSYARAVIASGYAQVDPENEDQVTSALGGAMPGAVVDPEEKPDYEPITSAGSVVDEGTTGAKSSAKKTSSS